jgi:putative DNA modification/repair radical SAM protein
MDTLKKVEILSDAAKYDVSCASSGSDRQNSPGGIGNASKAGICHSFTDDGRCISLLKILFTNYCIYDCAYCINRHSNDVPRACLTVEEVVNLTIKFYRRNYIEGLFLSSGVIHNADYTMEQLTGVAKHLRTDHKFNGYIHLKAIPGASPELIKEAGLYADRLSVNIEIPSEPNLKILAPDKNYSSVYQPMSLIKTGIEESREERKKRRHAPLFTPGGQSTQLIIGATPDSDKQILELASNLYTTNDLKRVYYSGYNPTNLYDNRLPAISTPPLKRENRLYQSDWLLRFYEFQVEEIVNDTNPDLDLELDPKLSYALRNPHLFPVNVNKADYHLLLRIPGLGVKSAKMIVNARRYRRLTSENLSKMGVVMKRAQYFQTCGELNSHSVQDFKPEFMRMLLTTKTTKKGVPDALQLKIKF